MKYIFVCNYGEHRSAIAARIAYKIGLEYNLSLETDYFGTADDQPNSTKIEILKNADTVFIMEEKMRFDIEKVLRYNGKVVCLNIPDKVEIGESDIEKAVKDTVFPEFQN